MNKRRVFSLLIVLLWLAFSLSQYKSSSEAAGGLQPAGAGGEPAPAFSDPPVIYGQVAKLMASDPNFAEQFADSVAISENTIVVGDPDDNTGPGTVFGAAFIFERVSEAPDSWVQTAKLTASDADGNDGFGRAVAISADTIVVGAPGEDDLEYGSGAVYIFERDAGGPGNWGEVIKLKSSNAQHTGNFGSSVAIRADTIVVGAYGEDGDPGDPGFVQGAAYVFERDEGGPGNWGETAQLYASDHEDLDYFGEEVAVDGDLIVVSSRLEDGGPGSPLEDAGAAYIYERDLGGPGVWGEAAKLTAGDAQAGDEFGNSVSVSGGTVAVGAAQEDGGAGDPLIQAGAVYLFEKDAGWGQTVKIALAEPEMHDYFGQSVSIDGDLLAVGALGESVGPGFGGATGVGHVFERDRGGPGNWGESESFHADDPDSGTLFGISIAMDGEYVIIGAPEVELSDPDGYPVGAAYVFFRTTEIAFVPSLDSCFLYYLDDFSNPNSGWPKVNSDSAKFGYIDGEYQILLKNEFWFGGALPGVAFEDYLVTTDIRNVNNRIGLYGLLFGLESWESFFAFFIDKTGHYEVWWYDNTGWSPIKDGDSPHLYQGMATNRIGIQRHDSDIRVFANGSQVTSFSSGNNTEEQAVGVVAISGPQENLDVRFDNLKVEPIYCGWGAYPADFQGAEGFENPGASTAPAWLEIDLPEGLFAEP